MKLFPTPEAACHWLLLHLSDKLQPPAPLTSLETGIFDLVPDSVAWKQKRNDDNGCSSAPPLIYFLSRCGGKAPKVWINLDREGPIVVGTKAAWEEKLEKLGLETAAKASY